MKIWHVSGAGNDFVAMDARGLSLDFAALAKAYCARLGADGFLALDDSHNADFRLHFYNADGSRGEMCGNGARCICMMARLLGVAEDAMTVETDAGMVYGWYLGGDRYRVQLNLPRLVDLHRLEHTAYVELGDPGIPHGVVFLDRLDYSKKEQLRSRAEQLRYDPAFPKGINVNFCMRLTESSVRLLTYERGVEDYTLACGTGSGSVAVVLWHLGQLPSGTLEVENPGGLLSVTIKGTDAIEAIYLEGLAEILGEYEI